MPPGSLARRRRAAPAGGVRPGRVCQVVAKLGRRVGRIVGALLGVPGACGGRRGPGPAFGGGGRAPRRLRAVSGQRPGLERVGLSTRL